MPTGEHRARCGRPLTIPDPRARTILAERDGAVAGLAHTLLGQDATWGAYLDNLHGLKRRGIGTRLLALTGQAVLDWSPSSGLYLWVLDQNSDARAFYAARDAACVERGEVPSPGGDASRLNVPEIRLYTNAAMTENLAYYPRHGYTETHHAHQDGFHRVFFRKRVDT